jgi:biopolymer transport protein ExbD
MNLTPATAKHHSPNMTPMVDVVMCILIFFMLGSSFILPEWMLKNSLPAARGSGDGPATDLPAVRVPIRVGRQAGETLVQAFGTAPLKVNAPARASGPANAQLQDLFTSRAEKLSPNTQFLICPERNVPYQDLITIYECCLKARMNHVAFTPAS